MKFLVGSLAVILVVWALIAFFQPLTPAELAVIQQKNIETLRKPLVPVPNRNALAGNVLECSPTRIPGIWKVIWRVDSNSDANRVRADLSTQKLNPGAKVILMDFQYRHAFDHLDAEVTFLQQQQVHD